MYRLVPANLVPTSKIDVFESLLVVCSIRRINLGTYQCHVQSIAHRKAKSIGFSSSIRYHCVIIAIKEIDGVKHRLHALCEKLVVSSAKEARRSVLMQKTKILSALHAREHNSSFDK